jgi:hypothetical protein
VAEHNNVIVLTGYWPPTNEMVRPFSTDPELNPDGWIGENWEDRGFDIYSYFPTFDPPDCSFCGKGEGDFEVDYQDTSADFWPIMNGHGPVAIMTTSRTNANFSWEMEMRAGNYTSWINDYVAPFDPTPTPPDADYPPNADRFSSLPMQDIADAVNAAGLGLNGFIGTDSAGSFLSGYMAYHGMWYQALHAEPDDPNRCVAAGHIHVGDQVAWDTGHEATKVSLRVLIDEVASIVGAGPADLTVDGAVDIEDLLVLLARWGACPAPPTVCRADINGDNMVGTDDLLLVLAGWGG